jgi:hypothetical protein
MEPQTIDEKYEEWFFETGGDYRIEEVFNKMKNQIKELKETIKHLEEKENLHECREGGDD